MWKKLRAMDDHTWRQFRADYSVRQLELRFQFEQQCQQAGISLTSRESVSYTHLDVYKRQLLVGVERIPRHTASQRTPGLFPLVEGAGTVSYTHLAHRGIESQNPTSLILSMISWGRVVPVLPDRPDS